MEGGGTGELEKPSQEKQPSGTSVDAAHASHRFQQSGPRRERDSVTSGEPHEQRPFTPAEVRGGPRSSRWWTTPFPLERLNATRPPSSRKDKRAGQEA